MNFYFAGGGDEVQSKKIDDLFINNIISQGISRIIYIPLATKKEKVEGAIRWFKNTYSSRISEIIVWNELNDINLKDLNPNSAVYIGGGNTFLLMDSLYNLNILGELISFVRSGGVVYGGSAGAIIFGKDLCIAPEPNNVGLKNTEGLNMLNDLSVWPHYSDEDDKKIQEYTQKTGNKVLAIPENGGIHMLGDELNSVGGGHVFLFEPDKILIS